MQNLNIEETKYTPKIEMNVNFGGGTLDWMKYKRRSPI